MNHRLIPVLLAVAIIALRVSSEDAPKVDVAYGKDGLASLKHGGAELLVDPAPALASVVLETQSLNEKGFKQYAFEKIEAKPAASTFDAAKKTLRQEFAWGTLEIAYAEKPDRLDAAVTLTNSSKDRTLANFDLTLLKLKFAAPPQNLKPKGNMRCGLDNIAAVTADFSTGQLVACCETLFPPVNFGLSAPLGDAKSEFAVQLRGGVQVPLDEGSHFLYPHGSPRVDPGKSLTIQLSLRFSRSGTPSSDVLADVYQKFNALHSPMHVWEDRRPIGMLILAIGEKSPGNPRGFFDKKKDWDIATPAGKENFKKLADAYVDRAVKCLKAVDAQGAIVWDVEGQENPHPITYLGDPRAIKTFAPEMDEIADGFFKKLTDAGLKAGICIRPSQLYKDSKSGKWAHNAGNDGLEDRGGSHFPDSKPKDLENWKYFPVVERLCAKIDYAKKRWGCTIFYIDTNGVFRPSGENNKFEWYLLNAEIWKRVAAKHPDVLLIPELTSDNQTYHAAQFAYTAPYFELDMGGLATPANVQKMLPKSFSVINVTDGKFDEHRDALLAAVKRGDIMMVHGWWSPKTNEKVKALYDEAKK